MITAPDVFTIEQDRYTPTVRTDWVTDRGTTTASPLYIGRTLHYSTENGWEVAGTRADAPWKPLAKGIKGVKGIKAAFDDVAPDNPEPGYYELIGPGIAANPHQLDTVTLVRHGDGAGHDAFTDTMPRTSLYAYYDWLTAHDLQGVLWTGVTDTGPRYAAVRRDRLPHGKQ